MRASSVRRAAWCALAIASVVGALAHPARAQEEKPADAKKKTASLGWTRLDGAEGCVGTRELAEGVEKILRRPVFVSAAQADLAIEGRAEKLGQGTGFKAVLAVADAAGKPLGTRELTTESSDCHALDEQVALAVALMVDPEGALAPPPPPPEKEDPPPPPPPPIEKKVYVPVPVPTKPEPQEEPWRGDVFAGFTLGFGWLPRVAPGANVGASLEPPWFFPIEATLKFFAPQTIEAPRGATILFYSFQGALLGCPLRHGGSIGEIRACAGLEGGFLMGDGDGFDTEPTDTSPLRAQLGATVKGRAEIKVVGPFHLGLATGVTVPFFRDEFVYTGAGGGEAFVFQQAPVAGTLDFFAMLAFP
ncbi:MAG: hypothetical protein JNL21_26260 [Myxococcales bacterium]|nr:hypothetical protein [Myxococcales bacterium]